MGNSIEDHSEPLLDSPHDVSSDIEDNPTSRAKPHYRQSFYEKKIFWYASALWFASSVLLFVSALLLRAPSRGSRAEVYSPVQDHIRYKTVVFDASSLKAKTIYMEDPSPEVDKAWEDLFDFGISWITPHEASLLPNATSRLVEQPQHYVTGLDVFHQLYCLNLLRRHLYPDYYVNDTSAEQLHCIDQLRQALMCASDTATMPWSWSQSQSRTVLIAGTTHTCRDFDAVKAWAKERKVEGGFRKDVYVEGSATSD